MRVHWVAVPKPLRARRVNRGRRAAPLGGARGEPASAAGRRRRPHVRARLAALLVQAPRAARRPAANRLGGRMLMRCNSNRCARLSLLPPPQRNQRKQSCGGARATAAPPPPPQHLLHHVGAGESEGKGSAASSVHTAHLYIRQPCAKRVACSVSKRQPLERPRLESQPAIRSRRM